MKAATVLLAMLLLVTSGKVQAASSDGAERNDREQQIDCLATNMFYEARGEPDRGKLAVGLVTLNRVKKGYANTVCDVVRQPRQFSWYKPGKIKSSGNTLYMSVRTIAETLYDEYYVANTYIDFTDGATHFHHRGVNPGWKRMVLTVQVGPHLFKKVRGT